MCRSATSSELWFQLLCATGFSKLGVSLEWMLGICTVRVNKEVPYCLTIQSMAAPRDDACNKAHTCLYLWIKRPTGHKLGIQARILVLQYDVFRVLKLTLHHRYIVSLFYSFVCNFYNCYVFDFSSMNNFHFWQFLIGGNYKSFHI